MLERYYHELLNFFARSLGCRDQARDVVQEAYARVLATDKPATEGGASRALLYTTARHIVIDQYRVQQRRQFQPLDEVALSAPPTCEPERTLSGQQQLDRLLQIVDRLPPRCRQAFVLYKFDGLSYAEIARQMGISVNMVEKHIINGMVACKQGMAAREQT